MPIITPDQIEYEYETHNRSIIGTTIGLGTTITVGQYAFNPRTYRDMAGKGFYHPGFGNLWVNRKAGTAKGIGGVMGWALRRASRIVPNPMQDPLQKFFVGGRVNPGNAFGAADILASTSRESLSSLKSIAKIERFMKGGAMLALGAFVAMPLAYKAASGLMSIQNDIVRGLQYNNRMDWGTRMASTMMLGQAATERQRGLQMIRNNSQMLMGREASIIH